MSKSTCTENPDEWLILGVPFYISMMLGLENAFGFALGFDWLYCDVVVLFFVLFCVVTVFF